MIYVALAEAAVLAAAILAFCGLLRSKERAHARREDLLLNQLLHAVGRPWQAAPADEATEPDEPEERTWTAAPEQLPVY